MDREEKKPERETQGNIERYLSLFDMESDD